MASDKKSDLLDRIISGIILMVVSLGLLSWWNMWDLSFQMRILISVGIGLIFIVFGGELWEWIKKIDFWS